MRFSVPMLCIAFATATPVARAADVGEEFGGVPASSAEAAVDDQPTIQGGTIARPLKPFVPEYPLTARRRGQEGWVLLSFNVRADGTVADPIVEDSSGIVQFERVALASVVRNRYQPATWNGKPVEQCATKVRYYFTIQNSPLGARSPFIRDYKETLALAQGDRAAEAEAKLDAMVDKGAWNNYEAARLWLLRASFQRSKGDNAGQLKSLKRAAFDKDNLEPELYRDTLITIFALQVEQKQYGPALDTYEKLQRLKPKPENPEVERVAREIRAVIHGDSALSFPGIVEYRSGCAEGRPNWQHELLRRKFTFTEAAEGVDDFELRCDWKRVVDKVSTEKTWEVPPSWGWCQVFVFGDVGAKTTLVEYPLAADQKDLKFAPVLTR
jgi:TonB family protein